MKILFLIACGLAITLHAEGPDLKRNQRVQHKAAIAAKAQADYAAEMKAWEGECEAKGLELRQIAANLLDCVQKRPALNPQQQRMMQAPPTAPAKPEEPK